MKIKDVHFYDDIIDLPHHTSQKHPPMKICDRAAQFGSFAALTGHSSAIAETGRLTSEKKELTEYAIEILNSKLQLVRDKIEEKPQINLVYFKEDEKKSGGAYFEHSGRVTKINEFEKTVHFEDGLVVPVTNIFEISGDFFEFSFEFDNE